MTQNFVTDVVVSLVYYRTDASTVGAQENLSWYLVLKYFSQSKRCY